MYTTPCGLKTLHYNWGRDRPGGQSRRWSDFAPPTTLSRAVNLGHLKNKLCAKLQVTKSSGLKFEIVIEDAPEYHTETAVWIKSEPPRCFVDDPYYQTGGWVAETASPGEWIQVDMLEPYIFTELLLMGKAEDAAWVTSFSILSSDDGATWASHNGVSRRTIDFQLWANIRDAGLQL